MRGVVPDLPNPVALRHRVPGVLQDDEFVSRMLDAFDTAMAPIVATLDGLAGYVDPWLAPMDFLDWLAGWVGVDLDDAWSEQQSRAIVAGAARMHRRRGTAAGLVEALEMAFDADVEVEDNGGTTWSATPGGDPPGAPTPLLTVHLRVDDPDAVDRRRVSAIVADVSPAHVPHRWDIAGRQHPGPPTPGGALDDASPDETGAS